MIYPTEILDKFGLDSIRSKNTFIRQIAVRSLAKGDLTNQKEKELKNLINENNYISGWAISVLAELRAPNMARYVNMHLSDPDLREISILALANSPTISDENELDQLIASDYVDIEILDALNNSSSTESQNKWLKVLSSKILPENYLPSLSLKIRRYFNQLFA